VQADAIERGEDREIFKATMKGLGQCFKGSKYTNARYMELMALMDDILQKARKEGLMAIEKDVEDPSNSPLFQKYPNVAKDHHVTTFITDYLRMMVSGNLNAHEIESLMDNEIETHHQEQHAAVAAIQRMAGALPAFGIVAAVLGVVNTMGSVGQPPAVLGGMIGSALVGTFLGVLLAYGMVGPMATRLKAIIEADADIYQVVRRVILASLRNQPQPIVLETARTAIRPANQPAFSEVFEGLRGK
jgi:chemotaxis protein MotA